MDLTVREVLLLIRESTGFLKRGADGELTTTVGKLASQGLALIEADSAPDEWTVQEAQPALEALASAAGRSAEERVRAHGQVLRALGKIN